MIGSIGALSREKRSCSPHSVRPNYPPHVSPHQFRCRPPSPHYLSFTPSIPFLPWPTSKDPPPPPLSPRSVRYHARTWPYHHVWFLLPLAGRPAPRLLPLLTCSAAERVHFASSSRSRAPARWYLLGVWYTRYRWNKAHTVGFVPEGLRAKVPRVHVGMRDSPMLRPPPCHRPVETTARLSKLLFFAGPVTCNCRMLQLHASWLMSCGVWAVCVCIWDLYGVVEYSVDSCCLGHKLPRYHTGSSGLTAISSNPLLPRTGQFGLKGGVGANAKTRSRGILHSSPIWSLTPIDRRRQVHTAGMYNIAVALKLSHCAGVPRLPPARPGSNNDVDASGGSQSAAAATINSTEQLSDSSLQEGLSVATGYRGTCCWLKILRTE